MYHLGDIIKIIDPAVRTESPGRFVFHAGDQGITFLVRVNIGAFDDAAGVAAVSGHASAAFLNHFCYHFSRD